MDRTYEKAMGQKIRALRKKAGLSQEQLQVRGCDIT